jgi:hypothetical protein
LLEKFPVSHNVLGPMLPTPMKGFRLVEWNVAAQTRKW